MTYPLLSNGIIRNSKDRDRIISIYSDIYGGIYSYDWETKQQTIVKSSGTGPEINSFCYSRSTKDLLFAGGGQGIYMIDLRNNPYATNTASTSNPITLSTFLTPSISNVPQLLLPSLTINESTAGTNRVSKNTLFQYEAITNIVSHPDANNETIIGSTDVGNLYRWDIRKLPYPIEQVQGLHDHSPSTSLHCTLSMLYSTGENGTINSLLCKLNKLNPNSYFTTGTTNNINESITTTGIQTLYQSESKINQSLIYQPYDNNVMQKQGNFFIINGSDNGMLEMTLIK